MKAKAKANENKISELLARINESQLQITTMLAIQQQDLSALAMIARELCTLKPTSLKTELTQELDLAEQRFYMWENIGKGG